MAQQPTSTQPQGPKNDKPARPAISKDSLLDYFKQHSRETVSYIIMITGILMLTYWPLYGGLLVGVVAGIFFADAIINYIKAWKGTVTSSGNYSEVARHIILLGLAIAFFISAPAIFLGAAVAIGIKQLFAGQSATK
jgi:hypothetical protein